MKDSTLRSESGNFIINGQNFAAKQLKETLISNVEEKETGLLEFSISSDEPYERWWGTEILSHKDDAVNLIRLNNSANILFNHHRDKYIAVCLKGWVEDGKTRVLTKWNLENADYTLPRQIYDDIAAEILKNSSVGYEINELTFKDVDTNKEIAVATKWIPFEGSIVTIPADYTVGVGRSYYDMGGAEAKKSAENHPGHQNQNLPPLSQQQDSRLEELINVRENSGSSLSEEKGMSGEAGTTLEVTREKDLSQERERSQQIFAVGHQYNCPDLAQKALTEGWSVAELRSQILDLGQKQKPVARTTDPIGMSQKEQQRYNFQKAINVALDKRGFVKSSFEKDIHDELVKRAKKANPNYQESENVLIPAYDLGVSKRSVAEGWYQLSKAGMRSYLNQIQQRDLLVGDPSSGGNLVETELLSERFIDIFRNKSILRRMGMQVLTGLVGSIDIPKQIAGATDGSSVYWVAEDTDVGKIDAKFGLVKFRPKNVGSYMYATRSMLLHSSIGIDNFIRRELAIALALGMDAAGLTGTGTNDQPLGIFNTPGVNPIIFGANGGVADWAKLVQFETKIAVANADESTMGWVLNPKSRGELKSRPKFNATGNETLWQMANGMTNQGYIAGYRAGVSNQVPSNLSKGTGTGLSAIALGDWSKFLCAEWGTYELAADPYDRFLAGGVRVRILHTCDMQALQEKAFSVATDMETPLSDAA